MREPSWGDYYFNYFRGIPIEEIREAEDRDRREWIEGVRQRLGLVAMEEPCPS